MPYIKQELRDAVDDDIDVLVAKLREFDDEDIEGIMNYVMTTLLCKRFKPQESWRYKWINRAVGVLECVKLEFYSRLARIYEDGAIRKNGDISVYKEL